MNFAPAFRTDVYSLQPNGTLQRVNPRYCLSDESAKQLAELLADLHPTITERQPFGGPYCFVNAGLVAQNWLDQGNPTVAERMARQDVVGCIAYYLRLAQGGW
jgi:hypothetical protein